MTNAAKLLAWYDKHGRDLPWRKTRDPYRVLVSEIMLQQTQVPRVMVFYDRWLKKFPNWEALARASNAQVIRAWSGLGYNRRALVLRDIAKQVLENGQPQDEEAWLSLKGIGPYTSAALAAFAHKHRTLPIDTNIRRVLGRLLLGIPFPDPKEDDAIRGAAAGFLPTSGRHYDVPQALFDLATAICTKTPQCAVCPMRSSCRAAPKFLLGDVQTPKAMIRKPVEKKYRNKPHPDRIYRGKILRLADTPGGIRISVIGKVIDPNFDPAQDQEWLLSMIQRLVNDGLIHRRASRIMLP